MRFAAVYPNPGSGLATFAYALAEPDNIRRTVYDVLGRRVRTVAQGELPAGEYGVTWSSTDLAPGVYGVRLEAAGRAWAERVTLVR